MSTLITRLTAFCADATPAAIPAPTLQLARCQLTGWLGGLAAGYMADEAQGILAVARRLGDGSATLWPTPERNLSPWGAAYARAALSCAFDFDDYLLMAHTGHSACGVPWTLASGAGSRLVEVLTAQVAANEVMGRLGMACLVGPQNGQLWTFVHLAGAVLAGGRLLGRSADDLAGALSLAFFQPPMALWPGFGDTSAKLLSAATPTLQGLMALAHAEQGMVGASDALDGRGGFLERFSFLPLEGVFDDLGERWVTDTLSIKPVPGCAYVTGPIECALACVGAHASEEQRPFAVDEIRSVEVAAGPMTLGMERLLGAAASPPWPAVAVNFSVRLSVALALLLGRLDPTDLTADALRAVEGPLAALAERITLKPEPALGGKLISSLARPSGVWRHLSAQGPVALLAGLRRAFAANAPSAAEGPSVIGPRTIASIAKELVGPRARQLSDAEDLAFPFGARVRVTARGGAVYEHAVDVPDGAAGCSPERITDVARQKLVEHGGRYADPAALDQLAGELLSGALDDVLVDDIVARLEAARRRAA